MAYRRMLVLVVGTASGPRRFKPARFEIGDRARRRLRGAIQSGIALHGVGKIGSRQARCKRVRNDTVINAPGHRVRTNCDTHAGRDLRMRRFANTSMLVNVNILLHRLTSYGDLSALCVRECNIVRNHFRGGLYDPVKKRRPDQFTTVGSGFQAFSASPGFFLRESAHPKITGRRWPSGHRNQKKGYLDGDPAPQQRPVILRPSRRREPRRKGSRSLPE
jgi:hypothetical protein